MEKLILKKDADNIVYKMVDVFERYDNSVIDKVTVRLGAIVISTTMDVYTIYTDKDLTMQLVKFITRCRREMYDTQEWPQELIILAPSETEKQEHEMHNNKMIAIFEAMLEVVRCQN